MRFLTFVNSAFSFKSFVFDNAFLADNNQTIVLAVCPRKNSNPVCSGSSCKGPIYDHSSCRLFEHVPLWDRRVFLHYAMRRVDCKRCGIKVELVPWAKGKQRMTNDFRHFLSTWARRLTWVGSRRILPTQLEHCLPSRAGHGGMGP
jgi:transposase